MTVDDLLVAHPQWAPPRPTVGIASELSDAELVSLAALQALLRFDSEARFVRYAEEHLRSWFPYVPERSGYNKRLRRSGELIRHVLGALVRDCPSYHDDVWGVDSTPVPCGRSRETQQRSDLTGWATYGYSASHSRYFRRLASTCSQHRRVCRSPSPSERPSVHSDSNPAASCSTRSVPRFHSTPPSMPEALRFELPT